MRFMLASGNRHKLGEFRRILAPYDVLAMPEGVELPPEGLVSFAENARAKARGLTRALAAGGGPAEPDLLCLGDDSGLEVEALGWAPGVTSARYAGVEGPGADAANVARLLREMAGIAGPRARRARFVCALAAVEPGGAEHAVAGHWWGSIALEPRGDGGFGYDPVFRPDGSDLTVAEWPSERKHRASHRGLAGRALLERLREAGLAGAAP